LHQALVVPGFARVGGLDRSLERWKQRKRRHAELLRLSRGLQQRLDR
jgi:hypothetical protein